MKNPLIIDAITIVHNEEKYVKLFIEHYIDIASKIFILAHECTDNTVSIAKSYGDKIIIIPFEMQFSNIAWSAIKAKFLAKSLADFCIVSDVDELIFPKDFPCILRICKELGITVPLTMGYHMVAEKFDFDKDSIYDVTMGIRDNLFDKKIVVDPKVKIEWSPGQHETVLQNCGSGYVESPVPMLQLRHYKYLDIDYTIQRNAQVGMRLHPEEVKLGMGTHHLESADSQRRYFTKLKADAVSLI